MGETANIIDKDIYTTALDLISKYDIKCGYTNAYVYLMFLGGIEVSPCDLGSFRELMPWGALSFKDNLSDSFIKYFLAELGGWDLISSNVKLSEKFIERHQDTLHWGRISNYQDLSCAFIEKNQNLVDWSMISMHQNLTAEFVYKFKNKLNLGHMFRFNRSEYITPEVRLRLRNYW